SYGKSTVVSARLPDDLLKELDTVCTKTGRSRNELITMCIEYSLKRIKIVDDKA
ncbi:MAG TPA: CopG family transcriptional regulator, partial [Ruminococcaceae bacterium]|nr:CopG family transcriptional regulator [Oscillospiraceae bacterium]